ncbi:MAG: ChaN family lipoprotein [Minwuia sp.]|nr:ChaN family lipoprotein [Minwuia sp.]
MRILSTTLCLVTLALVVAGGPARAERLITGDWQTSLLADHKLVGSIWVHARKAIGTERDLKFLVEKADFVLLGEKHNNPDHHVLQARLLRLAAAGKPPTTRPAVVWEMINAEQDDRLQAWLRSDGATAAGMGPALDWGASGWPAWQQYQPIAEVALDLGLAQIAGNIAARRLMDLAMNGNADAVPATVTHLLEQTPWTEEDRQSLDQELVDSHCGVMKAGDKGLQGIARIQRLRDASMALAMSASTAGSGAVLIAGSGHVRKDRGVPRYLRTLDRRARIAVVAMFEVVDGIDDPAAYMTDFPPGTFDAIIFTPRLDDKDPCAAMRKSHGKNE